MINRKYCTIMTAGILLCYIFLLVYLLCIVMGSMQPSIQSPDKISPPPSNLNLFALFFFVRHIAASFSGPHYICTSVALLIYMPILVRSQRRKVVQADTAWTYWPG